MAKISLTKSKQKMVGRIVVALDVINHPLQYGEKKLGPSVDSIFVQFSKQFFSEF